MKTERPYLGDPLELFQCMLYFVGVPVEAVYLEALDAS